MPRQLLLCEHNHRQAGGPEAVAKLGRWHLVPEDATPGGFAGATLGDTNVRVFGDTGVLMGVINAAEPNSKPIRVTLVCQKRSQGWQLIAAQLTD